LIQLSTAFVLRVLLIDYLRSCRCLLRAVG
jgi:hypothetical protein